MRAFFILSDVTALIKIYNLLFGFAYYVLQFTEGNQFKMSLIYLENGWFLFF